MNVFYKQTLSALLTISIVVGFQTAHASSAQATIDWNSFNVQLTDYSGGTNVPIFNWTSKNGYSEAYSSTYDTNEFQGGDLLRANNWTSDISSTATTTLAQSSSLRTANILQANSYILQGNTASLSNAQANLSIAKAENSGEFKLPGYGRAVLTLNWSTSITADQGSLKSYAWSDVNLSGYYSTDISGGVHYSFSDAISTHLFDGDVNHSGTFFIDIFSDGLHNLTGGMGASVVTLDMSYYPPVVPPADLPVPASVWLFGSGLIGLLSFKRRKNKTNNV